MKCLAAGFAVCTAFAFAGCASGRLSHREYQTKLYALTQRYLALEIEGRFRPVTTEGFTFRMSRWANLDAQVARTLERMHPPRDAEAANRLLAKAARERARETSAAVRVASRSRDGALLLLSEAVTVIERGTAKGNRELSEASKALRRAGYRY